MVFPEVAPAEVPAAMPVEWLRLGLKAGQPGFYEALVATLLEQSGATIGAIWLVVRGQSGLGFTLKASVGVAGEDAGWKTWAREQVQRAVAQRKMLRVGGWGAPSASAVFMPLVWQGAGLGVVLLQGSALKSAAHWGQWAGWAACLHARWEAPNAQIKVAADRECADALLTSARSVEWLGILAAHLQKQAGAIRASILREKSGRAHVAGISGMVQIKKRSPEFRTLEQAYGRLAASAAGTEAGRSADGRLLALRFKHDDTWGVLLEYAPGRAPSEPTARKNLAHLLELCERVLPQLPQASWRSALGHRLLERQQTMAPKSSRWVLLGLGVGLLLAGIFPVAVSFDGNCELQPATRFTVVSEIEGRLQEIAVEDGAALSQGQTIATLDTSTLNTRLEVTRETRHQQEAEARRFQGAQDMTSYRLSQLKIEQSEQEEKKLLADIKRANIVSPVAGRILSKDLSQRRGTVLRVGETLCEVGGLDTWNLEIAVPEEEMEELLRSLKALGKLPVSYRLKAGSTIGLEAEITSVREIGQMAYPVEGKNVIYVTVQGVPLPESLKRDLRPGFSGRAKIKGRKMALAQALTRHFWQYLRLHWIL